MSRLLRHGNSTTTAPRVDPDGELKARPAGLVWIFAVLLLVTGAEAINELFGVGGPVAVYQTWLHDGVIAAAAVLVLARAVYEPTTRKAWVAIGLAMALWSVGSMAWSVVYSGHAHVPYPTFADILWLAWYPLMAVGIVLLIKVHLPRFELHRWMDGLAVTLLVLAAGFALIIQPVAQQAAQGALATVIDFSYPVLDVLLMGALLGIYGLLGWRPDRMWTLIGLGVLATTIGDAAFAVQEARGVVDGGRYDFVWTLGAVCIAAAAWVTGPDATQDAAAVTGLRAVALLLAAQAVAAGIQIYALFGELARSERVVTLAVLVVTSVQIILNRPRPEPPAPPAEAAIPAAVASPASEPGPAEPGGPEPGMLSVTMAEREEGNGTEHRTEHRAEHRADNGVEHVAESEAEVT
jgi:hypothetical protein